MSDSEIRLLGTIKPCPRCNGLGWTTEWDVVPADHTLVRVRSVGFDEEGNAVHITQLFDAKTGDWVHSFIDPHSLTPPRD